MLKVVIDLASTDTKTQVIPTPKPGWKSLPNSCFPGWILDLGKTNSQKELKSHGGLEVQKSEPTRTAESLHLAHSSNYMRYVVTRVFQLVHFTNPAEFSSSVHCYTWFPFASITALLIVIHFLLNYHTNYLILFYS